MSTHAPAWLRRRPRRGREGLRDAQAKQTRARVLESAVACIDELGIARASSNEIARRAGMTWGAIQHHFGSREDLLLSVIESNFSELESNVRNAAVVGGTTLERVQALADLLWDYCSDIRFRVSIEILLDLRRDPAGSDLVAQRLSNANESMGAMWDEICVEALDLPSDPTIARILSTQHTGCSHPAYECLAQQLHPGARPPGPASGGCDRTSNGQGSVVCCDLARCGDGAIPTGPAEDHRA